MIALAKEALAVADHLQAMESALVRPEIHAAAKGRASTS
jgi:hypothetical protein